MSNPFRASPAPSKEAILFDDLQSARSAILSGSARSRHGSARGLGSTSTSQRSSLGLAEEPESIPLQDLKAVDDLPLPPPPVRTSNIRRVEIEEELAYINDRSSARLLKQNIGPRPGMGTNSVFRNFKSAFAPNPSPLARDGRNSDKSSVNPKAKKGAYSQESEPNESKNSSNDPDVAPNNREGSTVGNIYTLYTHSGREGAEFDGYKVLSPVMSVAETLRAPGTPPPKYSLPVLPGLDELLTNQPTTPLNQSSEFSEGALSTIASLPKFTPRNPFRTRSVRSTRSVTPSYADESHCVYDDDARLAGQGEYKASSDRLPLEREVSEALRRASGFSFYSMDSISSSILEPNRRLQTQVYDQPPQPLLSRPQRSTGSRDADARYRAEEHKFYDRNTYMPDQSSMRIPILHNGVYPDSPPVSPAGDYLMQLPPSRRSDLEDSFQLSPMARGLVQLTDPRQTGPDDDWETVGENSALGNSALGMSTRFSRDYGPGVFGSHGSYGLAAINRAGSSIANTSDAGSLSTHVPEYDYVNSSTDRIAQHPAKIEYSNDYRIRELKKTNMPVLLPSYTDHKVNGYLANSSRVIPNPTQWPPTGQRPMKQPHKHPFKSTPPEVTSPRTLSMPKSDKKKANHFPRLSKVMREETLGTPASDSRPSSWQYLMAFANGGATPGFNSYGSKLGSDEAGENAVDIEAGDGAQEGEEERFVKERSLHERLERRPMASGPAGAFYQGLRSDGRRKVTGPHQEFKPARKPSRHGVKEYPTNQLRPLSLSLKFGLDEPQRSPSQNSGYFYRPSQAPQRKSWRDLYSGEHLAEIERAAKESEAGRRRTEQWVNTSSARSSTMDDMMPRQFFAQPTLHPLIRISVPASMSATQDSVSIVVLFFCAFFPPLLGLYLLGYLNGVMKWATSGECSSFTKRGRGGAKALLLCWVFGAVGGLVVFVSWWFTIRKNE